MSDTYSYEVLEPGGHARLVGNVLDRISRPSANPASAVGSAAALLGDAETASWMERTTAADGAALVEAVYGNTLRWNQLAVGGNFPNSSWWTTVSNAFSWNVSDGVATLTADRAGIIGLASQLVELVEGHKYCLVYDAKSNGTSVAAGASLNSTTIDINTAVSLTALSSSWRTFVGIVTYATPASGTPRVRISTSSAIQQGDTLDLRNVMLFDLTAMFGAGNEPSTVAEFEALYPASYYPYDAGSLLPVRMEGIETTGFNQLNEEFELGLINGTTGQPESGTASLRTKNFSPVFPSTGYYFKITQVYNTNPYLYDADKNYIGRLGTYLQNGQTFTTPTNCHYIKVALATTYGTTYKHDICINIADPSRNGTYEPYWSSQRAIPVATYFPQGLRSAGTVCDELTETQAITRVGAVDLGTLDWVEYTLGNEHTFRNNSLTPVPRANGVANIMCSVYEVGTNGAALTNMQIAGGSNSATLYIRNDSCSTADQMKASLDGVMLHYALATPTTTPIDPPLPMSYSTGAGGTERVMVASGTQSAPPVFATRYPLDPTDLAASIAPRESATAEANHAVGDLIMLGWTLCKVTTAIARGEAITIGTNVTRTSVAAELAALSE